LVRVLLDVNCSNSINSGGDGKLAATTVDKIKKKRRAISAVTSARQHTKMTRRIRTNNSKKKSVGNTFVLTTTEKSKTLRREQDERDAGDGAIEWPPERRRFVDRGLVGDGRVVGVERVACGTHFAECHLPEFN
jgi:hypothetical protein